MVQELQHKWKRQGNQALPEPQQWQQFKIFYCTAIKEYDKVGLTTAKPTRANCVINQQAINQHTSAHMENLQEQMDNMTQVMSVLTQSPPASNGVPIPPLIQTHDGGNTSAFGTSDHTYCLPMEERNRYNKDRTLLQNKLRDLKNSMAGTTATGSMTRSATTHTPNEKVVNKDSNGNKWFQRAHY